MKSINLSIEDVVKNIFAWRSEKVAPFNHHQAVGSSGHIESRSCLDRLHSDSESGLHSEGLFKQQLLA